MPLFPDSGTGFCNSAPLISSCLVPYRPTVSDILKLSSMLFSFSVFIFIIFHSARQDSHSRTKMKIKESPCLEFFWCFPVYQLICSLFLFQTYSDLQKDRTEKSLFLLSAFLTQVSMWRLLFSQIKFSQGGLMVSYWYLLQPGDSPHPVANGQPIGRISCYEALQDYHFRVK